MRGTVAKVIAGMACVAVTACGGSSGDEAPAAKRGALGDARELTASYTFPTPKRVSTTIGAAGVVDPAQNELVGAPAGTRRVEVVFRWRDHGADPLPWDDLRFTAHTSDGRRARELYRVPAAQKQFGSEGPARESRVGFAVAPGARLVRVDLGSIIAGAPLEASWRLDDR